MEVLKLHYIYLTRVKGQTLNLKTKYFQRTNVRTQNIDDEHTNRQPPVRAPE